MKRVLPSMIFMVVAFSALLAQDSEQLHQGMDKANTQLAMNSCANEEAMRAESELNDIFHKLLLAARKESGAADKIMPKGRGSPTGMLM